MSDFKDSLNEEIEKRRDSDGDDTPKPSDATPIKTNNTKAFSLKSFAAGLFICIIFILGLVGWAWLKSDQTYKSVQEKLPSKTAIINTQTKNTQTTLTMPTIGDTTHNDTTKATDTSKAASTEHTEKHSIIANEKPYKANQVSFTKKTDKPLLSFVITGVGLSSKKTANIIENFSKEVSFSFSPYSKELLSLTNKAKNDGHEIWLSLPLETKEYPLNDTGELTLLVNASTEKNTARLNKLLNLAQNSVGFISQENHIFKTEDANVNPVIKEIFDHGFAIIDGKLTLRSFIDEQADKNDYPYAQNDLWLDNDLTASAINENIQKITQYGQQKKNVIVMLRPYPISLKSVQKFLNSNAAKSFELAPVSAQLKNN